jgi:hypothetical protein
MKSWLECLVRRLIVGVGTGTHISGNGVYQDLGVFCLILLRVDSGLHL